MSEPESLPRPKPRRRTKKALARKEVLISKYVAEGLTPAEAEARAHKEMRDNGRGDWREG